MFVSNLTDRDTDATVTLHSEKLNGEGRTLVWDALSREAIATDNGTIRLHLAAWGYRALRKGR